jgi:hypothetical protein
MTDTDQPFTEDELRLLFLAREAWLEGHDFRPADDLFPEAHRLAERGWLQRRFNQANGDLVFRWSPAAEAALDVNALTTEASESVN